MKLLELVYEGGEILDLCLEAQRTVLRAELRDRFCTVDLRAQPRANRVALLRAAAKGTNTNVLVRGFSGLAEAAEHFQRSSLLVDMLGRSDVPGKSEMSKYAFRTRRVFVYSLAMSQAVRAAGIGAVSKHAGPYFPRVDLERPEQLTYGVPALSEGTLLVLGKLKRLRADRNLEFEIVTTERVGGTSLAASALDVAARSDLLIVPDERRDLFGPCEGGILALCTGRALCTAYSDALHDLPYPPERYITAEKWAPGSYANAALRYPEQRAVLDAWPLSAALDWEAVPREILRRLDG